MAKNHQKKDSGLMWLRLDNAAKIYPAARSNRWSNVFRLSATLQEPVDAGILQQAADLTARRFPSMAVRLRRGVFWYYLQQLPRGPAVSAEQSYPLVRMGKKETQRCALRVIAYENRIAVECFHSLTDGTGALIFLKSLVAVYLRLRYGVEIPAEKGVLNPEEAPRPEELEDSFQKYAGPIAASRRENTSWHLTGSPEPDGFQHITCFCLPVAQLREQAKQWGVSVTVFLGAVMLDALQHLQQEQVPGRSRRKPVRLLIPVNLRNVFPSQTLRNFALYTTPEILPCLGEYSFEEICAAVEATLQMEANAKCMSQKIAANVGSERIWAVRLLPLFVKNAVMKAVFRSVGETKSCLSLSNLGRVELPEQMKPYVQQMDFILGVQATAPYNCGVISYGDTCRINLIRNTKEPDLEYQFHRALQRRGLTAVVESNGRE